MLLNFKQDVGEFSRDDFVGVSVKPIGEIPSLSEVVSGVLGEFLEPFCARAGHFAREASPDCTPDVFFQLKSVEGSTERSKAAVSDMTSDDENRSHRKAVDDTYDKVACLVPANV